MIKFENGHIWKSENIVDKRDNGNKKLSYVTYRHMHVDEIKKLQSGIRIDIYSKYANALLSVKVNGNPKTWKTRPDNISVPIKYGIYEYNTIHYEFGVMKDSNIFFIVVEGTTPIKTVKHN